MSSEKDRVIAAVTSLVGLTRSRYKVTRVIAPTGYGKSALFRYLEEILKPNSTIFRTVEPGDIPNGIRDIRNKIRDDPQRKELTEKQLIYTIKRDQLASKFAIHSTMV